MAKKNDNNAELIENILQKRTIKIDSDKPEKPEAAPGEEKADNTPNRTTPGAVRRGRPKADPKAYISCRVDETIIRKIRTISDQQLVPFSELIRQALEKAVKDYEDVYGEVILENDEKAIKTIKTVFK